MTAEGGPLTLDGLTVSIGGELATDVTIGGPATVSLGLAGTPSQSAAPKEPGNRDRRERGVHQPRPRM